MSGDGEIVAPVLERRIYRFLRGFLARPNADRTILWLGFILLLPSLPTGLATDDYIHAIMMDRPAPIAGFERAPLDIFRFLDPAFTPSLIAEGIFPWWDDPEARIAFMRPLTAATHWLDHTLWRNVGWILHLHSALWSLLLLAGIRTLYREWIDDRFLGALAFALYALDDARGWLVSWVAARNAVIGTAVSVWALVFYVWHRRGRLPAGAVLAPVLFALSLLGSEGAIAVLGYIVGHALFLEREKPLPQRVLRLWPYAAIFVIWRVVYVAYDYGVMHSGLYADPVREPLRFVRMFVENAPLLLGSQLGAMWSDAWLFLFIAPKLQLLVWVLTVAFIGVTIAALVPRVRDSAVLRCCAFGTLAALIPASPTFIADRLLTWLAIGGSVLLAAVIAPVLQRATLPAAQRVGPWVSALGALLVILHLIGLVFLPGRSRGTLVMREFIDRAEAGIPDDDDIRTRTLVFINPPHLPFASYIPLERAALGRPRPRFMHTLATSTTELTLTRLDAQQLRVRPRGGFLQNPSSRLARSEARPFHVGQQLLQGDLRVEVREVSPDGRPLEVQMRFGRPLEDPVYVWRHWVGAQAVPFTPPPVGTTVTLPAADYAEAMFGFAFPFPTKR